MVLGIEAGVKTGRGFFFMTNISLARNYLAKAKSRLKSILVLQEEELIIH